MNREAAKNHSPEFMNYIDGSEIIMELTYKLGPVMLRVVPNIDFTKEEFKELISCLGDAKKMSDFSIEHIMPVVFNAVSFFYSKEENEVRSVVLVNPLFTELFIVDTITPELKHSFWLEACATEQDVVPFEFVKAGFFANKRNDEED